MERETKIEALRKIKEENDFQKDPDNFKPSFRPNTQMSQQNVKGRANPFSNGPATFLREQQTW